MKCLEVQKRLKAFLDSELNPKDEMRIRQHLDSCPQCAQEREELSKTWDLLSELPAIESPGDLFPRILQKIETEETKGFLRNFLGRLIILPTYALAGLALIVGLFLGGTMGKYLYSNTFVPAPEMEINGEGEEPFYQEIFADLSPRSLEEVYFQLSNESERNGRS
jgi:anti-sigma factor RsiW